MTLERARTAVDALCDTQPRTDLQKLLTRIEALQQEIHELRLARGYATVREKDPDRTRTPPWKRTA